MSRTDFPAEMATPLNPLREAMEKTGDQTAVEAITDLISKAETKHLTIAFCGHFSAGKSSLINSLCGKGCCPPALCQPAQMWLPSAMASREHLFIRLRA